MVKVKIKRDIWDKIVYKHKKYIEKVVDVCGETSITGRKSDIVSLCTENFFNSKCEFKTNQSFKEAINKFGTEIGAISKWLFDIYSVFSRSSDLNWSGSIFVDETGIEVCPYCNINYTYFVKGKDSYVRGQIDHIVPKHGKYKKDEKPMKTLSRLLCMNIYNMIPCCGQCNQKKSSKSFKVYPYQFDGNNSYQATYRIDINNSTLSIAEKREQIIKLNKDDFKIDLQDDVCQEHSAWLDISKKLVLGERYNKHKDDLINLARLRLLYSESKISDMEKYGIVFPFYDESNDVKKPLNKQFRDIIQKQFEK